MHNYNKKCVHSEARGVGICRLGRASKLLGSCLANIDTALEPLCESIDGQRRVNDVCFMMSSFAAPDVLATCLSCECPIYVLLTGLGGAHYSPNMPIPATDVLYPGVLDA